jgi:hypothetical protein
MKCFLYALRRAHCPINCYKHSFANSQNNLLNMPSIATQTTTFLPKCVPVLQKKVLNARWFKRMSNIFVKANKKVSQVEKQVKTVAKKSASSQKACDQFLTQMASLAIYNVKQAAIEQKEAKKADLIDKKAAQEIRKIELELLQVKQEEKKALNIDKKAAQVIQKAEAELKKAKQEEKKAETEIKKAAQEKEKADYQIFKAERKAKKAEKKQAIAERKAASKAKKQDKMDEKEHDKRVAEELKEVETDLKAISKGVKKASKKLLKAVKDVDNSAVVVVM